MVFQDPMTSLDPTMTIGKQIMEGMLWHFKMPKAEAYKKALKLLEEVGITDAEKRMKSYPHQLSGGQLQRVLLAMALEPLPHILILDEPLSGVGIEGEHQLLEMLDEIRTSYDLSIFLSTHDFATLGQFADKVILLNRRVLKSGPPDEVLSSPEFYETFHLRVGKGGEG